MASGVYHSGLKALTDGTFDYLTDTINIALMDSSHSFSADDENWDDVSANEISGTGYTAGGVALASKAVDDKDTDDAAYLDAGDAKWAGAILSAYHAVIYYDSGVAGTSKLICSIDFGAEKTADNATFTVTFDAKGFLKLE